MSKKLEKFILENNFCFTNRKSTPQLRRWFTIEYLNSNVEQRQAVARIMDVCQTATNIPLDVDDPHQTGDCEMQAVERLFQASDIVDDVGIDEVNTTITPNEGIWIIIASTFIQLCLILKNRFTK